MTSAPDDKWYHDTIHANGRPSLNLVEELHTTTKAHLQPKSEPWTGQHLEVQ
jgi:hypothetical protein